MKRRMLATGLCISLLCGMLLGCGAEETAEKTVPELTEETTEELTEETIEESVDESEEASIPEPEKQEETVTEPVSAIPGTFVAAVEKKLSRQVDGDYMAPPMYYYEENTAKPYYVGKQDNSFLESLSEKPDEVLYLTNKKHLEGGFYYDLSDLEVAKIEGTDLIPLKQGVTVLTTYDESGTKVDEKSIAVTTYNDGRMPKQARSLVSRNWCDYQYAFDAKSWRDSIHTIPDMIDFLIGRRMVYDGVEPQWVNVDEWTWMESGETIFYYNKGVCIEVAQLANYMLAGDFEDWGNILIHGNQGHIYNWFYEDGYYYIFDFTQVISENWDRLNTMPAMLSELYIKSIHRFTTLDEVKEFALRYSNVQENYFIVMFSLQGHDYLPVNYNSGMHDSRAVVEGRDSAVIKFEDVVYDEMNILLQYDNVTVESVKNEDLPIAVRMNENCVYGNRVKFY